MRGWLALTMISRPSLCEACAFGQASVVEFLISLEEVDLDALGTEGISPLCIATTWGHAEIVQLLVDAACDPNVRNSDGTHSTPLHAAACQEHGKIAYLLLAAGADAMRQDGEGRTPCDFASVSDAVWPLFAARGLDRTPKAALIEKRIIRKVSAPMPSGDDRDDEGGGGGSDDAGGGGGGSSSSSSRGSGSSTLPFYSRPGSAYVRAPAGGASAASAAPSRASSSAASGPLARVPEDGLVDTSGAIDPLEYDTSIPESKGTPNFSLWRD